MNSKFLVFLFLASLQKKVLCLSNISDKEYNLMPQVFQFDDFETCLSSDEKAVYCMVTIDLGPKNFKNTSNVWNIIEEVSANRDNYKHDLLRHGLCVKKLCTNRTTIDACLNHFFEHKYENFGLVGVVEKIRCETRNSTYSFGTIDIVFVASVCAYIIFVIVVSIALEIIKFTPENNNNSDVVSKSPLRRFFSIFSIFENWRYLMFVNPKDYKSDFMLFLQGIRFGTTIGVIVTHAVEINVVTPIENPRYIEEIPTRFVTMVLANGGTLVQIYFVISAWLLSVNFFEKLKNSEKITVRYILKSIISRYIKLTPLYALIVASHSTWLVHLARGPFWDPIMGEDYRVCRKNWWKNLLFFNNFVIDDGLCMFQSWYLSVDFQFHILGLIILWITQKISVAIIMASGFLIVVHIVLTFGTLLWYNWEIAVKLRPELLYFFGIIYSKEWQATWTTTYSNLPGFVSGLSFGYLYWKCKDKQIFRRKCNIILWWILSWSLSVGPLLFSSYYMTTQYYANSRWFAATYGCLYHVLFTFGVGLFIFGISLGVGGIIKVALEWGPLHVLAQLSFGTYLIHFTILKINAGMRLSPSHVSDYVMVNEVITNMTISYLCSIVLTILFQMPATAFSKLFVNK